MKINDKKIYPILIFLFVLIFLIVFTNSKIISVNSAARFLTIESLVEKGGLAINEKHFCTIDKMIRGGNFFSSKPPVLSVIGAGIYFFLHNFFNLDFPETVEGSEYLNTKNISVYLITFTLIGGTFILLLFYFYKTLNLFKIETNYKIPLLLGLAAGTLYLPYSTVLNNHTIAGCFLFISFYYLLKIKFGILKDLKINFYLILSGFFVSLSAVIDLPTGLTFLPLFFFYIWFFISKKKTIFYILAILPPIIIHLILNFQITGDFLPAQFHPEYAYHENQVWNRLGERGEFNQQNSLSYAFNIFFGSRGLFIYSPILLFSVYSIFKIIKAKNNIFKQEAILFTSGFLIISLFYILKVRNYSGNAFGFRWFIAITPLLYFFTIFLFLKKPKTIFLSIFITIFIVSTMISSVGVLNPWSKQIVFISSLGEKNMIDFSLASNLIDFYQNVIKNKVK